MFSIVTSGLQMVPAAVLPGAPGQPQGVQLFSDGAPTSLFSICRMAAANGVPIDQYNGVLSPSGIVGSRPRYTALNSSINAVSCRVDYFGVPISPQTAQMQASAGGVPGPFSASSNNVTPTGTSDIWDDGHPCYFIQCGGSQVGLNLAWNEYFNGQTIRYVLPGTARVNPNCPAGNAPANPPGNSNQLIEELTPANAGQSFGLLVNFFKGSINQVFNTNWASRLGIYLYPTSVPSPFTIFATETLYQIEAQVTAASPDSKILTFANQTMAVNTLNPANSAVVNRTRGTLTDYASNSATQIVSNFTPGINTQAGDYVYGVIADQSGSAPIGDISRFVLSPVPGVLTPNQWNAIEFPLDATGMNMRVFNGGLNYKFGIAFAPGIAVYAARSAYIA